MNCKIQQFIKYLNYKGGGPIPKGKRKDFESYSIINFILSPLLLF